MARSTPEIIDGHLLYLTGTAWQHHAVGSPQWVAWLAHPEHRLFRYAGLSVRREIPKGKTQGFWYAYRKHQGRVLKVYLGPSAHLTLPRLALAAQRLQARAAALAAQRAVAP